MNRYRIISDEIELIEGERYITYGIACDEQNLVVHDITSNSRKIQSFVLLINENDLQPVHIMDVIEDFLDELQ